MVLQDVGTPGDSFSDNPYPSDNNAYTSTAPDGQRYFDATNLPQPVPLVGPLLGFSSRAVRLRTEATIAYGEQRLRRSLTPEEALALAGHLYKLEQTKSYFTAASVSAGVYRWYSTWESNKYPFFKPKPESIDPNKFMFVRGPMASYARHSWRFACYTLVASELGKLAGTVFGQPAAGKATLQDPRLQQFSVELRDSITSETARAHNRTAKSSADERRAEWEAAAKARADGNGNAETQSSVRKPTYAGDDMSPTAGNESWPSSSENSWGESGSPELAPASSDSAPPTPPRQQPYSQRSRRPARRDEDDASPTGGMFQDEVQRESRPGESAWDRLRRGGVPAQQGPPRGSQPPHREQREGSTLGDSFTFVESDDDRKREKERAQREFDARVEQERKGQEFNENRKW